MRAAALLIVACALPLAACSGGGEAADPSGDSRYGHRYTGVAPDGRETVLLTPADSIVRVLIYPAVLDSVAVRPEKPTVASGESIGVEVLLKGTLPDACSTLENAQQGRLGNLISVELTMRQPRGRACAQVVRPFRFYLPLDGRFDAGSYTLKVNGSAYPFRIREDTDIDQ